MNCPNCKNPINETATFCEWCGAQVIINSSQKTDEPTSVKYYPQSDTFYGTVHLLVKLAMRAIQERGWTIVQVNESLGLVNFKTGVTMGSWSGVSGTLNIEEVSPNTFRIIGTGKQNLSGLQLVAFDFGEAKGKARKVIETMKKLANT